MLRLIEAGIVQYYLERRIAPEYRLRSKRSRTEVDTGSALKLESVLVPMLLLLGGLVTASLMWAYEASKRRPWRQIRGH